jgi:hypothetical protein
VEAPWQTGVAYGASECLCTRPFRTEAASFVIVMGPRDTGSTRVARTTCHHPPYDATGTVEVLTGQLVASSGRRLKILPVRKLFLRPDHLGWPSVPHPWGRQGVE